MYDGWTDELVGDQVMGSNVVWSFTGSRGLCTGLRFLSAFEIVHCHCQQVPGEDMWGER